VSLDELRTKIFADGADLESIAALAGDPMIKGFTTNPTLMRKAGLDDYAEFARQVLDKVTAHPVSFEVVADGFDEMRRQAATIAGWADNVYVKVPVTDTHGRSTAEVVRDLSQEGVKVNVTAILTLPQVEVAVAALEGGAPAYVSVFAGRIADTGRDPVPTMARSVEMVAGHPGVEVIWASPRELLNLVQADEVGCHIITMTAELLGKVKQLGKDLEQFSLETVQMFHDDAVSAGLSL
jgi:transaldolase